MSDVPPPLEEQGPREPDHPAPVRSRGIRGGKAAKRKRTAYMQANPDYSYDQVAVIQKDKTQLYTRPGWTPDSLDEDDEEEAAGTFRPPEPAGPPPGRTLPSEPSSSSTAPVAPQKASSHVIIPTATTAPPAFSRLIRAPPAPPAETEGASASGLAG